jgi:hypothetical protein
MISVSLIGGLGNQMFQYAAAKALAERHGVSVALDISGFRNEASRSFLLDRLSVPETDYVPSKAGADRISGPYVRLLWRRRIDRVVASVGLPRLNRFSNHYCEPHFHYDTHFGCLGPETCLFGHFQSERYFRSIAHALRAWFLPRAPLGPTAAKILGRIENSKLSVSIHVRRGDYLKRDIAKVHGILAESYYCAAIDRINSILGTEAELFVFSDDPVAAKRLLDFVPESRLIHVNGDPDRPWEDLTLMAGCRHHVIANSSFSWWAAWLNPSSEKVVIGPHAWFAPSELRKVSTRDLYPEGWVLV